MRDNLIEQRIKDQYQYLKSINDNVNENKKEALKLSQLKLKKAMNAAQEAKGMGVYAYVNHNKLRSFHIRSKSINNVTHIEVEGKEAMRY